MDFYRIIFLDGSTKDLFVTCESDALDQFPDCGFVTDGIIHSDENGFYREYMECIPDSLM